MDINSYQQNWKGEPKHFNLMCVVRLLIVTVVAGVCILKKGYANLHLLASQKEKKFAMQKS